MPLSDFDHLLRDLVTGFGTTALVKTDPPHTIEGRFLIDPFDVTQTPSDVGLNVTQTWFYYDQRHTYEVVGPGVTPPGMHDHLVIRGQEYEIVKIDRDDLGEHALQLLMVAPT